MIYSSYITIVKFVGTIYAILLGVRNNSEIHGRLNVEFAKPEVFIATVKFPLLSNFELDMYRPQEDKLPFSDDVIQENSQPCEK